jgi:hypothetical protein
VLPRPGVIQPEQLDDGGHIIAIADATTHPARFGEDVMRVCLPVRDQLLAYFDWKWQIGQPATVQVAELTAPEAELDAAESMRLDAHAFPTGDLVFDERDEVCRRHVVHGHRPSVRLNNADGKPAGSIIESAS